MIWFPWMGNGFGSIIFQGLPSLCFPWKSEIVCNTALLHLKMEASLLDMLFFGVFWIFFMILSNLALNETVERHMIMFILNLHSFCTVCEVQVNWSQALGGQSVTTGFVTHGLRKNELDGRRKAWKEGILSRIKQEASNFIIRFPLGFFFINQTITATNYYFAKMLAIQILY